MFGEMLEYWTWVRMLRETLSEGFLGEAYICFHSYSGSIFEHFTKHHGVRPKKQQLQENTTILSKAPDRYRLSIQEALLISQKQPSINRQFESFTHTLKLFRNSRPLATPPTTALITDHATYQPQSPTPSDPPTLTNTTNSFVSPSIQSRINRLIQNTRNDNQPNLTQLPSPRRLRTRPLPHSQP